MSGKNILVNYVHHAAEDEGFDRDHFHLVTQKVDEIKSMGDVDDFLSEPFSVSEIKKRDT